MADRSAVRVTLLTDFGTVDGYVAAMKGVIADAAPDALLEDASHDLPQGDVRAAMWALRRYWRLYPQGSVHLVVVDPGVGTERRALAIRADGRFLVVPDNGVASLVLRDSERWEAVGVAPFEAAHGGRSTTFHGRDLFAPVAGRLAAGAAIAELGRRVDRPVRIAVPVPETGAHGVVMGEIVRVDRFGNLVSNLPGDVVSDRSRERVRSRGAERVSRIPGRVEIAGRKVPMGVTYASVEPGSLVAVVNSDDLVEVAARDGSAAERLGVGIGAPIRFRPVPPVPG